jgi:hypothetical protein
MQKAAKISLSRLALPVVNVDDLANALGAFTSAKWRRSWFRFAFDVSELVRLFMTFLLLHLDKSKRLSPKTQ